MIDHMDDMQLREHILMLEAQLRTARNERNRRARARREDKRKEDKK